MSLKFRNKKVELSIEEKVAAGRALEDDSASPNLTDESEDVAF